MSHPMPGDWWVEIQRDRPSPCNAIVWGPDHQVIGSLVRTDDAYRIASWPHLLNAAEFAVAYLESVKETLGDHYRNDEADHVLAELRDALTSLAVPRPAWATPDDGRGRTP